MSIAVLLACYDHRYGAVPGQRLKVGIPYVETAVYEDPVQEPGTPFKLYSMRIRGEWEMADAPEQDPATKDAVDDEPTPAA